MSWSSSYCGARGGHVRGRISWRTLLWCSILLGVAPLTVEGWRRPKVIVDVDTGVDDAFALAMLLSADAFNEVELLAITTVSGNTDANNASLNTLKLLHAAERLDVPVFQGSEYALEITPSYDYFFGYDGFGDIEYPDAPNSSFIQVSHAVLAMLQVVHNNPNEVVILCLGPLTNIAMAARLDPTFSSNVAEFIILGGAVAGRGNIKPGIEFNFYFDPLAAFIALDVPKKAPLILVPWETVSISTAIPLSWRIETLGAVPGPVMELLNAAEAKHLESLTESGVWNCGDLLAAAVLVNPEIVLGAEPQHLSVEVHASSLAGAVMVDYSQSLGMASNVVIVKLVDVPALQEMMLQYLASGEQPVNM